jgi:hypothetical protein
VPARSPSDRARWKEEMTKAGRVASIDPQVWTIPWNVHRQATTHGHSAWTYLAPYVSKVAISNRRIVSLQDRPVPCTYRKPGSARLRPTTLDAMEFLRRFLPLVLPHGFMQVRHFGFLQAGGAIPLDTLRLLIWPASPLDGKPALRPPRYGSSPAARPAVDHCRSGRRLWTANSALLDTG